MGKPGAQGRTTCTRCRSRVQTDRATSYSYLDGRPDEAYCRACHAALLGVRENCGHDLDRAAARCLCPGCAEDRKAERQLAKREQEASNRQAAARAREARKRAAA